MFGIGLPELIVIAFVALVVFEPGKMPEIGGPIGKAMRDFKNAQLIRRSECNSKAGTSGPAQSFKTLCAISS